MALVGNLHVCRDDVDKNFTKIPNMFMQKQKLTFGAKSVFCYLLGEKDRTYLPEGTDISEIKTWRLTLAGLTSKCMESIGCVKRCMDELMRKGYVLRADILGPRNLRIRCEYIVYQHPIYNPTGEPVIIREADFERLRDKTKVYLMKTHENTNVVPGGEYFPLKEYGEGKDIDDIIAENFEEENSENCEKTVRKTVKSNKKTGNSAKNKPNKKKNVKTASVKKTGGKDVKKSRKRREEKVIHIDDVQELIEEYAVTEDIYIYTPEMLEELLLSDDICDFDDEENCECEPETAKNYDEITTFDQEDLDEEEEIRELEYLKKIGQAYQRNPFDEAINKDFNAAKKAVLEQLRSKSKTNHHKRKSDDISNKERKAIKTQACKAVIEYAIEAHILAENFGQEIVDRTVKIITDTIVSDKFITIGSKTMRSREVSYMLLRLNYDDVNEVLRSVQKQKNIQYWDKYVLTSLYKAADLSPNIAIGAKTVAIVEMEEMLTARKREQLTKWWNENFRKLRPLSQRIAMDYMYKLAQTDVKDSETINDLLNGIYAQKDCEKIEI